jgi:membrane fusion protein, multidrug efflux system
VESLHFQDGQVVPKGEVLLTLHSDEERARLLEARALLQEQIREVRRIEEMVARKLLPQSQLDERITQRAVAAARVQVAESAVADRIVRAPFAGVLGLRSISPGALVGPGDVITTLDTIATLRLDFPVPSVEIASLRVAMPLTARTPALPNREFRAEVASIDSRVNAVDRSVTVRARLDNADMQLRPGLLLNVALVSAARSALVIPEQAIIQYQRQHYVFLVNHRDGDRLERRDIHIGLRMPGSVEVVRGLAEGDLVVTEGATSARAGQPVQWREPKAGS